eukprot:gene27577-33307_t
METLIRANYPAELCTSTKEELLAQKKNTLDVTDDCPICRDDYRVLCRVARHPSTTTGASVPLPPPPTTSHPSMQGYPSTASNAIRFCDELGRLKQANVKVQHVSDSTVSDTMTVHQLIGCLETSTTEIQELYPYYNVDYDQYTIDWQTLLSSGDREDVCQAKLNELLVDKLALAANTSASSCGMFKLAREMCLSDSPHIVESAVYTPTAKADLTGIHSPQAFEIKPSPPTKNKTTTCTNSDIDLLEQVLLRMSVEIYCNALLSNFTVLAATGRFAWVVVFERQLEFFKAPPEEGTFESITFRRIRHSDLLKVFFSNVERSKMEPSWYLTTDAPLLFNIIGRLSYPFLCATRLYEKSESNVYAVSLPRTYKAVNVVGSRCVGLATSRVDLMIKVIHSQCSFETESSALSAVAPVYNSLEPRSMEDRHYALGTCSYKLDGACVVATEEVSALVTAFGSAKIDDATYPRVTPLDLQLRISSLTSDFWAKFDNIDTPFEDFSQRPFVNFSHPCVWRDMTHLQRILLDDSLVGGTIVMRVGVPLTKAPQKVRASDWREGVCKCLLAGRMANWSQGDVRLRNTLLFGNRIQLIDYNHAVQLMGDGCVEYPTGQRQFVEGSLYRSLGPRLAKWPLDTVVDWTMADDFEMAMRGVEELMMSDLSAK